jgi:signal transduction histidine kinase
MGGHYPASTIRRLASGGGVEALASAALGELADAAGAEVGALWGARSEAGALELLAVSGLAESEVPGSVVSGTGLSGRAVASGRVVTARHASGGLEVVGLTGPVRVACEVHVPLRVGEAVVAVAALGVLGAEPSTEQLERVQELADAAGVALTHLQVRESAQVEARVGRAILEATPDAIALVGSDGDVVVANEPMRALLASGVDALTPPGDPALEHNDELAPPGSRQLFARWSAPLEDDGDLSAGRIVVLRDVTAERDSERLKDEVLALVSHELRTPLTSVVGYVDLVLDGADELPADVRRFLEVVDRNARRLLRLVGDLLFVAQAEAGRMELARGEVDLGGIASDAVEAARPEAERSGATLVLDAEPVRPFVGDRDRCRQMLDNLIANAVKFAGSGGHIQVTVSERGETAVVEVADDGPGIPAEDQQRVFERFARASNATDRATPGAGLGLTVVKAIVEGHGGEIGVLSAPGAGTTIRIALPL